MSCCHKHQQQRYHNQNTKICMFIHYMYFDILFPLTKAIPIIFERVTTHFQTLQTWTGHNATRYHNFNALPYTLPYIFSQFSLVWDYLQRTTTRYRQIYKKMYINTFLKKLTATRMVTRSSYGIAFAGINFTSLVDCAKISSCVSYWKTDTSRNS